MKTEEDLYEYIYSKWPILLDTMDLYDHLDQVSPPLVFESYDDGFKYDPLREEILIPKLNHKIGMRAGLLHEMVHHLQKKINPRILLDPRFSQVKEGLANHCMLRFVIYQRGIKRLIEETKRIDVNEYMGMQKVHQIYSVFGTYRPMLIKPFRDNEDIDHYLLRVQEFTITLNER